MDARAFFAEHGWLVVRDALPADAVEALVQACDAVCPPASYTAAEPGGPVVERIAASRAHPVLARAATDPTLARHAAEALGCRRVQLLQDTLLIKPPGAGRVAWHQDDTYTGFLEPAGSVSVRVALTDCTVESGCLHVLDGSHRWGLVGPLSILSATSVTDTLALLDGAETRDAYKNATPLLLRKGDLSVHHCLTFHGSAENRGTTARKTLILRLFDSTCTLVASRLPSPAMAAYFPTDPDGHLSHDAFPVAYDADSQELTRPTWVAESHPACPEGTARRPRGSSR